MKNPMTLIKSVFSFRQRLASAESWAKYLGAEVEELNKRICRDNFAINDLIRENEMLCGANTKLIKELASVRNLLAGYGDDRSKGARNAQGSNVWQCRNCRKGSKAAKRAIAHQSRASKAT